MALKASLRKMIKKHFFETFFSTKCIFRSRLGMESTWLCKSIILMSSIKKTLIMVFQYSTIWEEKVGKCEKVVNFAFQAENEAFFSKIENRCLGVKK